MEGEQEVWPSVRAASAWRCSRQRCKVVAGVEAHLARVEVRPAWRPPWRNDRRHGGVVQLTAGSVGGNGTLERVA